MPRLFRRRRSYARRRVGRSSSYKRRRTSIGSAIVNKYLRGVRAKAAWDAVSPLFNQETVLGAYGPDNRQYNIGQYADYRIARGRGSYGLGKLGRKVGGFVGRRLGSRKAGAALGGFLGRTAGDMLGSGGYVARGLGAYDNTELTNSSGSNMAVNGLIAGSSASVPRMEGGDEIGSVVLTHKECLGTVTGSVNFENTVFDLNPGLKATFPFLSQIAANYQEYAYIQLQFTYVSLLSETTNSGQVGNVIITTDYNAGNPPFTSSIDMLNNVGSVSARPIDGPIIHGVECDPAKNVLGSMYVRTGSVPVGQDPKTYDLGTTQLATEGMPANDTIIGQWWVSYQVLLRKPILYVASGKYISTWMYKFTPGNLNSNLKNTICGTSGRVCGANNIGLQIANNGVMGMRVIWPLATVQGVFRLRMSWVKPRTQSNSYPSFPAMDPEIAGSNLDTFVKSANAWYPNVYNGFCNPSFSQAYGTFEDQTVYEFIVRLNGSFAVPTYFDLSFPYYGGSTEFRFDQFEITVDQVNPLFTAIASDNPSDWISYQVGTV